MIVESGKWVVLIATVWIQAFTGTNFDFSSYSSELKSVLEITQLQLNCLSVASDMGKAFGWCSGFLLMYFPLWVVMFMSAFLGLLGYGFQWLVIQRLIALPYFLHQFQWSLVLIPVLQQQPQPQQHSTNSLNLRESIVFLCLNILALVTGLYLLFLYSLSSSSLTVARVILVGAIFSLSNAFSCQAL
ncbi:unnamed protein product [Vicia faba]|uniref:Nodulin-like domain-containing protein n=1 Tax=Vicia faba TaxID=3906 RepID=A0AAV0YJ79_VICFA|nr:unnamed protein product [Vicia faba]